VLAAGTPFARQAWTDVEAIPEASTERIKQVVQAASIEEPEDSANRAWTAPETRRAFQDCIRTMADAGVQT